MKDPKTVLITGATAGIGNAAALRLAEMRHRVVILARDEEKLKATKAEIIRTTENKDIYIVKCDLSSLTETRNAAGKIKNDFPIIDVLLNNAGINTSKYALTEDGLELTFAVNHFAPFLLTGLLLENITNAPQGRVINVSSAGHNKVRLDIEKIRDNKYQGKYATYRRSKLANIMFTIDLSNSLKDTNVTVNALHPGLINTDIGKDDPGLIRRIVNSYKKFFAKSPYKGADTLVYLATSNEVSNISGKYFANCKVAKTSKSVLNEQTRKKLWDLSEKVTGFKY